MNNRNCKRLSNNGQRQSNLYPEMLKQERRDKAKDILLIFNQNNKNSGQTALV